MPEETTIDQNSNPNPGGESNNTTSQDPEWLAGVDPTLITDKVRGFKDLNGLINSYNQAQSFIGKGIPDENTPVDIRDAFFTKLGRPVSADKYDWQPPEGLTVDGATAENFKAFKQKCFEAGMGKATYGTGSSVMVNIGETPMTAPDGLVTSVGFAAKGKVFYAFEGNIHCTGATIQWMADKLHLISSPAEIEQLATSVHDNGGVYLVPAFAGLGAPWWNPQAKAMICGMTLATEKGHVCRAALEAIAYQIKDLVDLMTNHAGIVLKELRVDGGPTKNHFLMQFQADMLNACINRSDVEEASAMGAMVMNGLARNVWADFDEVASLRTSDNRIVSAMSEKERNCLYSGWHEAVNKVNVR